MGLSGSPSGLVAPVVILYARKVENGTTLIISEVEGNQVFIEQIKQVRTDPAHSPMHSLQGDSLKGTPMLISIYGKSSAGQGGTHLRKGTSYWDNGGTQVNVPW